MNDVLHGNAVNGQNCIVILNDQDNQHKMGKCTYLFAMHDSKDM